MTTQTAHAPASENGNGRAALPRRDPWPLLLAPVLALAALPLIADPQTWATLTIAGLAMGMMIFLMASGLTLVFGLMDVLNFGHGAFISVGAFMATVVLGKLAVWSGAPEIVPNIAALLAAIAVAALVAGLLGWLFERVIIAPVYGQHLKQILVTMGGLIVAEQLLRVFFGPDQIPLARPAAFKGAFIIGAVAIEKYRIVAVVLGLIVFAAMQAVLRGSRLGLLIRAGVENREMVESLGYRIRRIFVLVFAAGSALAGLGGAMWGLYQETVTAGMGMEMMVSIFIVIIIGGLGSVGGCFLAALLVGLTANYAGFLAPKLALGCNILLMALILLWRPQGLYAVARREG
ncbi:MAG TPA: branched-chain amino acid ABC transporter permease [Candidatus Cybelea sp.]|nr:branched-chain amino acid ABC transporter permease [Candidatus Cybelea sp.]